jgi:NAD(P)-dependent dehydrogenase (short-subunit alcohol dehydrogenase family)
MVEYVTRIEAWFEGDVAFVTGAGAGIGRASAQLFSRRGARVMVTDVDEDAAHMVAEEIRGHGGESLALRLDVRDTEAVTAAVNATCRHFGRLDLAFNNAGITGHNDAEWDDDAFAAIIAVNLIGIRNCLKAQLPVFIAGGRGAIVNTASTNGFVASSVMPMPAYTASKHGVIGLTRDAALQYAKRNIRVNALCPGMTQTGMNNRTVVASTSDVRIALENMQRMGRIAQPEEIAEAAVWLCSSKASFVNGHAMVVDGGLLAGC